MNILEHPFALAYLALGFLLHAKRLYKKLKSPEELSTANMSRMFAQFYSKDIANTLAAQIEYIDTLRSVSIIRNYINPYFYFLFYGITQPFVFVLSAKILFNALHKKA